MILEVDGKGKQLARNIHGVNPIAREVSNAQGREPQKAYYLYNGHADVTALVSKSGIMLVTYYYDAFGNILEENQSNIINKFCNNFKYSGCQHDSETGLYYLNSRMCDPSIARFLHNSSGKSTSTGKLSKIAVYYRNPPPGKTVIYLHANPDNNIKVGMIVKKGDMIDTESDRGTASDHTHVEVREGMKQMMHLVLKALF